MRNPYKEEFTRLTLQHAMDASAARNNARQELAALTKEEEETRARDDARVVESMRTIIAVAGNIRDAAAQGGVFPAEPDYSETKWLIGITLAACETQAVTHKGMNEMEPGAAASFVAQATGAGAVLADKADTAATVLSAVGSPIVQDAVKTILLAHPPFGLSPLIRSAARSIVTHALNDAAHHISVLILGKTSILPIASLGLSALSVRDRLTRMQYLAQRYKGYCGCCDVIEKICLGWMSGLAGKAIDAVPVLGGVHVVASIAMKVAHRIHKKMDPDAHHAPYYLATELWQAARSPVERGYKSCARGNRTEPDEFRRRPNDRCPLALLALATLCGGGNPAKGMKKAAAAALAEQGDAVTTIKRLIAANSDNAFESAMARLDWAV